MECVTVLFALGALVFALLAWTRTRSLAAEVAALKGFLHDMARLGGLYRVASFVGLAVSRAAATRAAPGLTRNGWPVPFQGPFSNLLAAEVPFPGPLEVAGRLAFLERPGLAGPLRWGVAARLKRASFTTMGGT